MDLGVSSVEGKTAYVGLDVHARTIAVSFLREREQAEQWQLENEPRAVANLARRFRREGAEGLVCCYEAGPTGFALQRNLQSKGIDCRVIAPALVPRRPGDRVKTDRRDAKRLAELLRAGLLTEVHQPSVAEEAVRDLSRARVDAVSDKNRAQHRLSKFLLRHGIRYGKSAWTHEHRRWLRSLSLGEPAGQVTFDRYLHAVEMAEEQVRALVTELGEVAESDDYRERVGLLRCFRGIDTVTAMTVLAELGDVSRFGNVGELAAYVGLVPSEHSSGPKTRRGGITKTGNGYVRRAMVEAAWHNHYPYRIRPALVKRRKGQPGWAVAMTDRAGVRLQRRYRRLIESGKPPQVAVTAVARELLGAVWAVLRTEAELRAAA